MGGLDNGGYKTGACFLFILPDSPSAPGALEPPLSWGAARERCLAEGGHLAEIHSEDEHGYVKHRVGFCDLPIAV